MRKQSCADIGNTSIIAFGITPDGADVVVERYIPLGGHTLRGVCRIENFPKYVFAKPYARGVDDLDIVKIDRVVDGISDMLQSIRVSERFSRQRTHLVAIARAVVLAESEGATRFVYDYKRFDV